MFLTEKDWNGISLEITDKSDILGYFQDFGPYFGQKLTFWVISDSGFWGLLLKIIEITRLTAVWTFWSCLIDYVRFGIISKNS